MTTSLVIVTLAFDEFSRRASSLVSSSVSVIASVFHILMAGSPPCGAWLSPQKQPTQIGYDGSPPSNSTHTPAPAGGIANRPT